jgi:hypothetical protein
MGSSQISDAFGQMNGLVAKVQLIGPDHQPKVQAKHTGISPVRNKRSDVLLYPFRREVCIFQPRIDAVDILLARLEVSLWTRIDVYQALNHLTSPSVDSSSTSKSFFM